MKNLSFLALLFAIILTTASFKDKKPAPVTVASKALVFPVAGKKANIGDRWGASRAGGRRKHKGIDIFAKKGTPVLAISDGIIVTKGTFPIGGKVLWLKSEDYSWTAYYAHLDKWLVKEGQYVKKGQVIGTVGNTGNARTTPPHLHFGISKNNDWVNPYPYVKNSQKIVLSKSTAKKATDSKKNSVAKKKTTASKKKAIVRKKSVLKRKAIVAKRSTNRRLA